MKTLVLPILAGSVVLAQAPAAAPKPVRDANAIVREATETFLAQTISNAVGQTINRVRIGGDTMTVVSGINVGPTVTGAPYSAEAVNESVQVLSDGNRIVERSSTKIYRDSQGRERRETGDIVMISDPVAKVSYSLNTKTKTATKSDTSGSNFFFYEFPVSAPAPANARVTVTRAASVRTADGPVQALGSRVVEGVPATGTRTTTVIPAGQIGNERPIEIVDEQWYSGELQVVMMTRHADPRSGETTYKLTNVQRTEPAGSLFEVPPDYKIETGSNTIRLAQPAPVKAKAK